VTSYLLSAFHAVPRLATAVVACHAGRGVVRRLPRTVAARAPRVWYCAATLALQADATCSWLLRVWPFLPGEQACSAGRPYHASCLFQEPVAYPPSPSLVGHSIRVTAGRGPILIRGWRDGTTIVPATHIPVFMRMPPGFTVLAVARWSSLGFSHTPRRNMPPVRRAPFIRAARQGDARRVPPGALHSPANRHLHTRLVPLRATFFALRANLLGGR